MLRRSKSKRRAPAPETGSGASGASGVVVASVDADLRELLARVIGRSGHDVEQFSAAGAAVEALTVGPRLALVAFVADDRVVSLVSDVRGHPEAIVSAVPVLVVTDDEAMVKTATGAGADATLIRPFHADELADELAAVLARSPEERAEAREAAAGGDD